MYNIHSKTNHESIGTKFCVKSDGAMKFMALLLIVWLSNVSFSKADILFQDNFDAQPDWTPTGSDCGGTWAAMCPDNDIPPGWTWYRHEDAWNPLSGFPNNKTGQRISSEWHHGATGKAWIKSSEASKTPPYSNYKSDSILSKYFPTGHKELYASMWVKFPVTWKWQLGASGQFKMFRIEHFEGIPGVDSPFKAFSTGNVGPVYLFLINDSLKSDGTEQWGLRPVLAQRCSPITTNYHCDHNGNTDPYDPKIKNRLVGNPKWADPGSMGDGQWHHYEFHVKMNSAPGARDGVAEFWLDGVLELSSYTNDYLTAGADPTTKWNKFSIGGNWNNWFSDPVNHAEEEYAIDDVVVSTTRIGAPLPPGKIGATKR